MAQSQVSVLKLYRSVIEDVITGVRDSFLDEGVDEQVLQELKQIWETKLVSSKAVEPNPDPPEPQPPQMSQKDGNRVAAIAKAVHLGNQSNIFSQHTVPLQQSQASQQQMVTQTLSAVPPSQPSTTVIMADPNKQVPIQITLPAQGGGDAQPRVLTIQVPASALQGNQLHQVLTGPVISATMALPPHLASTLLQQHVTAALQGQAAASTIHIQPSATPERQTYQSGAIRQLDGALEELEEEEICQIGGPCVQSSIIRRLRGPVKSDHKVLQLEIPESIEHRASSSGLVHQHSAVVHNIGHQLDGHEDTSDEDEDEDDDEDIDDDDENDEKEDEENEEENNGGQEEEPLNSEDDVSDEDPSDLFDTDNVVVCQYDKITRSRNKWKFYLKDGIMNLNGKDFVFQKASGDAEW